MATKVTHQYRMYPTHDQERKLLEIKDGTACAWNVVLQELLTRSKGKRILAKKLGISTQSGEEGVTNPYSLVSDKGGNTKKYDRLKKAQGGARREAASACITAWDSWVMRTPRDRARPKFKKPRQPGPLALGGSNLKPPKDNVLTIFGMNLKFKKHRELPESKWVNISVDNHNRWWVGFSVPREIAPRTNHKEIGADVGTRDLLWTSDGYHWRAPPVNKRKAKKKAKLMSRAEKLKKGGNKQRKILARVNRIDRDRVQRQNEIEWQIANQLGDYKTVRMEDLRIANMMKKGRGKRGLNRALGMARMYKVKEKVNQKCAERGNEQVDVNPRNSSNECSKCGKVDKRSRKGYSFKCKGCGTELHADYNAAVNLNRREERKKKEKKSTGGKVSDMAKKRWSKTNTADKAADAQTGVGSDSNVKPSTDLGEMPEVGNDQVT